MAIVTGGQVGPQTLQDGGNAIWRSDRTGALMVADTHSRFQEAAYRQSLFSAGMTTTSIANATFTTGTLGATCTPVIGIWNPVGSGKNCIILQVRLQAVLTALTSTGPGAFVWATAVGQSAISTGITPLNRFSLQASGSVAKGFANTALTGLSGNLTVQEASGVQSGGTYNASNAATAAGFQTNMTAQIDLIDGAFIVPPGGVLALLATTTPVAVSAASSMLWEEVNV